MKLDWAILSNFAEVQGNLSYVLGGGWDTAYRPDFPAVFGGALTLRLLSHPSEVTTPHQVVLQFWTEDGKPFAPPLNLTIGPGAVPPDHPIGWDLPALIAINLQGLPIPRPGRYSVEILIESQHVKSIPFRCLRGRPPGSPPPTALPTSPPELPLG
jgi:hypothetical protein